METVTMHYTTFQVFEKKTGRPICTYTDTRSCLSEIFHGLDTVDEFPLRTFERTYTVLHENFSKNSRFKEFRGKAVKFLQLNGEDFFYEVDGELHRCLNYH